MKDRLSRVSRRSPCAVCGRSDKACLFRPDGSAALCSQRVSDKPARGGCIQAWWHYFDDPARPTPKVAPKVEAKPEHFRAPIEHVDGVLYAEHTKKWMIARCKMKVAEKLLCRS